jgi:predicted alpha/beta-fold hydrolase
MSARIIPDTFIPPFYLANGHFQTIVPHLVLSRRITYRRQRITLADSDFIDLDWLDGGNNLLVLCHGLEGDSQSAYMTEMATQAHRIGFTVLAWNYRGCSDTDNLSERMYHSGATSDLEEVLLAIKDLSPWQGIYLVGFSLGGNMLMKFMGELETGKRSPQLQLSTIKGVAGLSAALDVMGTSEVLSRPENFIYQNRFLITLKQKLRRKLKNNLLTLPIKTINSISSIWEFDELYTAPTNGFGSAAEYYQNASALPYLPIITTPCLIVSAYNDPILSEACFPSSESLPANVSVCYTAEGGHVSYWDSRKKFWALHQILGFFLQQIEPSE